jgi:single-strand DNA-binding protein
MNVAAVNKVILVGNVGKEPEIRSTQSGDSICNLSLATTSKRKDKASGESIEDTQWHRLVFFGKLAEIAGQYVTKGSSLYVEGTLKYGKYTDKTTGVERYTTDIMVSEMQMLGGKSSREQAEDLPF